MLNQLYFKPSWRFSAFLTLLQEVQLDSILEAVCAQFEAVVTLEKLAVSRVRQVTNYAFMQYMYKASSTMFCNCYCIRPLDIDAVTWNMY